MLKKKIYLLGILLLGLLLVSGCNASKQKDDKTDEETEVQSEKDYDEVKNMVFLSMDAANGKVVLQDIESGIRYELAYNGGTYVYSSSGAAITMEQIETGEIVEASFLFAKSKLKKLQILKEAWRYDEVENLSLNRANFRMNIYDSNYKFNERLLIFSDGKEIGINELHEEDTLTIRGIGKDVCSITVTKGHGFVVLEGYDNFVDGWVEIGSKVISRVVSDMVLVAPEGEYVLTVEKNGFGGYKNITVVRDEEVRVDISDLKEAALQSGNIRFEIEPAGAKLYIAGQETDYSELVTLDYGNYKIKVTADGYDTYEGTLTVNDLVRTKQIKLSGGSEDGDSSDDNSGDKTSDSDTTDTDSYKVTVNEPSGVEAYLDGAYVGKVPVSFKKVAGTHTLTFRKDGYTTKSYTIELDSEKKDVSMSFPELAVKGTTGTGSTESSLGSLAGQLLESVLTN